MKFIKGNPDKLEGKGAIYLEKSESLVEECPRYPAIYIGTNFFDLILPGEHEADLKELKEQIEQFNKAHENEKSKLPKGLVNLLVRPITIDNTEELNVLPGDLYFAGRAVGKELILPMLSMSAGLYVLNYSSQIFGKKELNNHSSEQIVDDFRQYSAEGLVVRLTKLSGELIYNRDDKIRRQILAVAKDSPFIPQVAELIRLIYEGSNEETPLMDLNVRLAGAIRGENYREAQRLNNEIEKFKRERIDK